MDGDPGDKYIGKFQQRIKWYLMENKDFVSNNKFKLNYKMKMDN